MCPYCGEEVPDDSSRCWKCGTEIVEGTAPAAGDDEEEIEAPAEEEPEPEEKRVELVSCPFCDSPMPRSAMRCKECGRTVRSGDAARGAVAWKLGPWIFFLAVAGAAAIVVALVVASRIREKPQGPKEVLPYSYQQLDAHLDPAKPAGDEQKRQEVWNRQFEGKYVKWVDHYVLKAPETNPATGEIEVELTEQSVGEKSAQGKKPVVILSFAHDLTQDEKDKIKLLKVGEKISYTGRLNVLGGGRAKFTLDHGSVKQD